MQTGAASLAALGLAACATPTSPAPLVQPVATPLPPQPSPSPTVRVVRYVAHSRAVRRVQRLALPLRLEIPKLRVDAPVVAVGLAENGEMDVPEQAADVAWYRLGPPPGARGNAILAGHVDWKGVRGVFAQLQKLTKGDLIVVRGANGAQKKYVVAWNREWQVNEAPVETVFEATVGPVLTLITCGGRFSRATRQYDKRVVVRAVEA